MVGSSSRLTRGPSEESVVRGLLVSHDKLRKAAGRVTSVGAPDRSVELAVADLSSKHEWNIKKDFESAKKSDGGGGRWIVPLTYENVRSLLRYCETTSVRLEVLRQWSDFIEEESGLEDALFGLVRARAQFAHVHGFSNYIDLLCCWGGLGPDVGPGSGPYTICRGVSGRAADKMRGRKEFIELCRQELVVPLKRFRQRVKNAQLDDIGLGASTKLPFLPHDSHKFVKQFAIPTGVLGGLCKHKMMFPLDRTVERICAKLGEVFGLKFSKQQSGGSGGDLVFDVQENKTGQNLGVLRVIPYAEPNWCRAFLRADRRGKTLMDGVKDIMLDLFGFSKNRIRIVPAFFPKVR